MVQCPSAHAPYDDDAGPTELEESGLTSIALTEEQAIQYVVDTESRGEWTDPSDTIRAGRILGAAPYIDDGIPMIRVWTEITTNGDATKVGNNVSCWDVWREPDGRIYGEW